MRITATRTILSDHARVKGVVDITFDHCFVVRGMKILEASSGLIVAMPRRQRPDGTHQDIVFPASPEMKRLIEESVLDAYKAKLEENRRPGSMYRSAESGKLHALRPLLQEQPAGSPLRVSA
jgi:stage V sporulation protein G